MNEQMQVMLVELAQKLGTTAEHLWGVMCKQVLIQGIADLCFYIALPFMIFAYLKWLKWFKTNENDIKEEFYEFMNILGLIVSGVVLVVFILAAIFSVADVVSCFVNPEYMALKDLLGMLAKVK